MLGHPQQRGGGAAYGHNRCGGDIAKMLDLDDGGMAAAVDASTTGRQVATMRNGATTTMVATRCCNRGDGGDEVTRTEDSRCWNQSQQVLQPA